MGLITPNDFPSLQALYTAQLRYLLSTETQIVKGLTDMIGHADTFAHDVPGKQMPTPELMRVEASPSVIACGR